MSGAVPGLMREVQRRDASWLGTHGLALPQGTGARALALLQSLARQQGWPACTVDGEGDDLGRLFALAAECDAEGEQASPAAPLAHSCAPPVTAPAPRLLSLPGLQRCLEAAPGRWWLRCGDGPQALIAFNAPGMTMDVWHDLVQALAPHCTIYLLADPAALGVAPGLPDGGYGAPAGWRGTIAAADALRQAEKLDRVHLAGWCGGAKTAVALARAWPEHAATLALLAPSFAGIGEDSAFETSLHTMCKVVQRLPQTAATMARSMSALLARAERADAAALLGMPDAATSHWIEQPYATAADMLAYSRQVLAFREHDVAAGAGGPLPQPLLLLTGSHDRMTSSARARAVCAQLGATLDLELQGGSHYFIHQNAGSVAALMCRFMAQGLELQPDDRRWKALLPAAQDSVVAGEL